MLARGAASTWSTTLVRILIGSTIDWQRWSTTINWHRCEFIDESDSLKSASRMRIEAISFEQETYLAASPFDSANRCWAWVVEYGTGLLMLRCLNTEKRQDYCTAKRLGCCMENTADF